MSLIPQPYTPEQACVQDVKQRFVTENGSLEASLIAANDTATMNNPELKGFMEQFDTSVVKNPDGLAQALMESTLLKDSLKQLEWDKQKLVTQNTDLARQLEQAIPIVQKLQTQVTQLKEQQVQYEAASVQFQAELETEVNARQGLEQTFQLTTKERDKYRRARNEFQEALRLCKTEQSQRTEQWNGSLQKLNSQVEELQAQVNRDASKHKETKWRLTRAKSKITSLEETNAALSDSNKEYQDKLNSLQARFDNTIKERGRLEQELHESIHGIWQVRIEKLKEDAAAQQSTLNEEITQLKIKLEELRKENEEKTSLTTALETVRQEKDKSDAKYKEVKKLHSSAKEQTNHLQHQLKETVCQLETEKKSATAVREELNHAREQLIDANIKKDELSKINQDLQATVEKTSQENDSLSAQLADLTQSSRKMEEFQLLLQNQCEENERLEGVKKRLEGEKERLEVEKQCLKREKELLGGEADHLKAIMEDLEGEKKRLEGENKSLEEEKRFLVERKDCLQKDKKSLEEEKLRICLENVRLCLRNDELHESVKRSEEEKWELAQNLDAAQKRLSSVPQVPDNRPQLYSRIVELETQKLELEDANKELKGANKELRFELKEQQAILSTALGEVHLLRQDENAISVFYSFRARRKSSADESPCQPAKRKKESQCHQPCSPKPSSANLSSSPKYYSCKECSFKFRNYSMLQAHLAAHTLKIDLTRIQV